MAKYILIREGNAYARIAEDEESKNYWINNTVDHVRFEEISDSDYQSLLKKEKWFASDGLAKGAPPFDKTLTDYDYLDASVDFTRDDIEKGLNNLIEKIELRIERSQGAPAIWTTSLNTLKNIDLSTLTFPINGCTWVDCLIKNDIQVPSSMEF